MAYFLDFDERALKEWRKLGKTVRNQFQKKLTNILEAPRIEANKLRGYAGLLQKCGETWGTQSPGMLSFG